VPHIGITEGHEFVRKLVGRVTGLALAMDSDLKILLGDKFGPKSADLTRWHAECAQVRLPVLFGSRRFEQDFLRRLSFPSVALD
jgi:hypothetical protein